MATELLEEFGEFFPFGYVVKTNGDVANVAVHDGNEQPESKQIIDALTAAFRRKATAREIIASAICCDVLVTERARTSSALQISIEHSNGETVDVFLPYEREPTGEISHGEPYSENREANIFN